VTRSRPVPLKRLFRILNGSTPKSDNPDYWDGEIVWITPEDIGKACGDTVSAGRRTLTESGYRSCGTSLVPKGSIVLTTRAPIGNVALAGVALCTNQGCKSLVPLVDDLASRFFYYQMLSLARDLKALGNGTTFIELGSSELGRVGLLSPAIADQRAVIAFLDRETAKADSLIAEYQRLVELLEEKRVALITRAVTKGLDPRVPMKDSGVEWVGKIPEHWTFPATIALYHVALGKMLDEKQYSGEHLMPYIRVADVQWDRINTDDLPTIDIRTHEYRRCTLEAGDLIVCEGGSYPGRSAIWDGAISPCAYQKALHRLRPRDPQQTYSRFMLLVMEALTRSGWLLADQGKSTIAHIPAEDLRRLRVPCPPFGEQMHIAETVRDQIRSIDHSMEGCKQAISLTRERRSALISAAVMGQIDVRSCQARPAEATV
jgi:type I restriction enzyme, S subunit